MDAIFWLGLFLIVLGSSFANPSRRNGQQLRRLERKVDLILSHLGLDPNQGVNEEVMELVKAGQKIQAIKVYREQTGVGLKDAKDYVEGL